MFPPIFSLSNKALLRQQLEYDSFMRREYQRMLREWASQTTPEALKERLAVLGERIEAFKGKRRQTRPES